MTKSATTEARHGGVPPGEDVPVSHSYLGLFAPWFKPLDRFVLLNGVIEAVVGGWYFAVVFGTLYNFIAARLEREAFGAKPVA